MYMYLKKIFTNIRMWVGKICGLSRGDIHYVGGSEALPPPLTVEEETALLDKLSRHDYAVKKKKNITLSISMIFAFRMLLTI
jgi:hypothetical protein